MLTALQKLPADRFATAAEFAAALVTLTTGTRAPPRSEPAGSVGAGSGGFPRR